jgi:homoserine kinase
MASNSIRTPGSIANVAPGYIVAWLAQTKYGLPANVQVVSAVICPHTGVPCGAAKPAVFDLAARIIKTIKLTSKPNFLDIKLSYPTTLVVI